MDDHLNPYGPPIRNRNNLKEKSIYARRGKKRDLVYYSTDRKFWWKLNTIYQIDLPSERDIPQGKDKYKRFFKVRKGTYLSGHNDKYKYRMTVAACQEACMEEKSFFCKSFDFYRGNRCALSKRSKVDTPKSIRLGKSRTYTYYERILDNEAPKGVRARKYRGF